MTREEMDNSVLWNTGGVGLGICSFAGAMMWAMDTPGPEGSDYPSIVAVNGKPADYTDEEMAKIADFAKKVTARYDRICSQRRGANLIIIGKPSDEDGKWLRKRLTWEYGLMYSNTLDEALELMSR